MNHFAKTQWRDLVATLGIFWKVRKKKAHPQYLISEHDYFPVVFLIHLAQTDEAYPSIPDFPTPIHYMLYLPQAPSKQTPGTPHLMSELVAGEAENHQAPGETTLQFVELVEVSGGCSSE